LKTDNRCPECGAELRSGLTCQDHFYQMLAWESEVPAYGEVHHLSVLCYHLQHPSLYSPAGLSGGIKLLEDFLERGWNTLDIRHRDRAGVDSGNRTWKIKGTPASHGQYEHPVHWRMTAVDVTAGSDGSYCEKVRKWARLVLEDIRLTDNARYGEVWIF
jgi:hypothetical protein